MEQQQKVRSYLSKAFAVFPFPFPFRFANDMVGRSVVFDIFWFITATTTKAPTKEGRETHKRPFRCSVLHLFRTDLGTVQYSWKGSNTYVNAISHIVVGVKPLTIIRKFGSGEGQSEKPNPNVLLYFQSALFPYIRLISIKILCLSSSNFLCSEPPTCVCVCLLDCLFHQCRNQSIDRKSFCFAP